MSTLQSMTSEVLVDGLVCSANDPDMSFIDYAFEILRRVEAATDKNFTESDTTMIRKMLFLARRLAEAGFKVEDESVISGELWKKYTELKRLLLARMTKKSGQ